MEGFLHKYGYVDAEFFLKANGVKEDTFFSYDGANLYLLLKDYRKIADFMSDFVKEKSAQTHKVSVDNTSYLEYTFSNSIQDIPINIDNENTLSIIDTPINNDQNSSLNLELSFDMSISEQSPGVENVTSQIVPRVINSKNKNIKSKIPDDFEFKKNELYDFLMSSRHGKIILGIYKNEAVLDLVRLKNLIIDRKFEDDPINYKITKDDFEHYLALFIELFPYETKEVFYVSYKSSANKTSTGTRGALYNCYKYERNQLRRAGLLAYKNKSKDHEVSLHNINSMDFLVNQNNHESCTQAEIIKNWRTCYHERLTMLEPPQNSKNKPASLELYVNSFSNILRPPMTILLLQSDFEVVIEKGIDKLIYEEDLAFYNTAFSDRWPSIANKVISASLKSNAKDCKAYSKKLKKYINNPDPTKNCNIIVALLVLPYCMTVTKWVKKTDFEIEEEKKENPELDKIDPKRVLTKEEISRCFILFIEDPADFKLQKEEQDKWIQDHNLEHLPYVIVCGSLNDLDNLYYVVFNQDLFPYNTVLQAVDACYKCLVALHKWPVSDYAWSFISQSVYKMNAVKFYTNVSKFLTEIVSFRAGF